MSNQASNSSLMPGEDFNQRGDIRAVLLWGGWTQVSNTSFEAWRRPGKSKGIHASLRIGRFYVFTTEAPPFEAGKCYNAFAAYAFILHNGDFSAAARDLRHRGYGSPG